MLRWPIFQGGRIRAASEAARVRATAALVAYRAAVRQALADAETALTRYGRAIQRHDELLAAVADHRRAAEIAGDAARTGVASRLDAVRAQRRTIDAELNATAAHVEVLVALAALNKALGGGWEPSDETAPSDDAPEDDAASDGSAGP